MISVNDFRMDFSSSAFQVFDGEPRVTRIIGKWCEIEVLDTGDLYPHVYDIYIVRPHREPISKRKMTALTKVIEALPEYNPESAFGGVRVIDNGPDGVEAYLQTTEPELVRKVALLAGVKRRRRYSEATKQASTERLAKMRAAA